jgi:hypothetical protein
MEIVFFAACMALILYGFLGSSTGRDLISVAARSFQSYTAEPEIKGSRRMVPDKQLKEVRRPTFGQRNRG